MMCFEWVGFNSVLALIKGREGVREAALSFSVVLKTRLL